MTGLLKDVMTERADRLDSPTVDIEAITRTGARHVRRRRIAAAGAVAVAAITVGVLQPWPGDESDGDTRFAGHGPAQITWAEGSVVHGQQDVDLGHEIDAYVQTDSGYVSTDKAGTVWSWTGGEPKKVGEGNTAKQRLRADGDLVAWVEFRAGEKPEFVVLDQATGEVTRNSDATHPGMDGVGEGGDFALVYAVDGRSVYWHDQRGLVRFNADTEESVVLGEATTGWDLLDADNGLLLYDGGVDGSGVVIVINSKYGQTGPTYPNVDRGDLSPGATYLMGESGDDFVLLDRAGRKDFTPAQMKDYFFMTGYRWVDDDTYAAAAVTNEPGREISILRCEVVSRSCSVVVENLPIGSFQLPTGDTSR